MILNNLVNHSIPFLFALSKNSIVISYDPITLPPPHPINNTLNLFNLYTPTIPKIATPLEMFQISQHKFLHSPALTSLYNFLSSSFVLKINIQKLEFFVIEIATLPPSSSFYTFPYSFTSSSHPYSLPTSHKPILLLLVSHPYSTTNPLDAYQSYLGRL